MIADWTGLAVLALGWAAYGAVHSVLASLAVKGWVATHQPAWMPAYRLTYNALALLLLLPLLGFMHRLQSPPLWTWHGLYQVAANGLAVLALMGFLWSFGYYDLGEFLGLRQWRQGVRNVEDQERFKLTPLHRVVRHPWYALGLVLLWTRDMDLAFLTSALCWTLYLVIGSRLEERKLVVYHGEAYRRYLTRVPGLVPQPGKYLTRTDASELEALSHTRHDPAS